MKPEIKSLNERIAYTRETLDRAKEQLDALEKEKKSHYRDSRTLPFFLMEEAEQEKIRKMPMSEIPCEFCGKMEVRKSRKSVCMNCNHVQS